MHNPLKVKICEVGPRDGLQNEQVFVSTENKVRLIDMLSAAHISYIEAASFVSPKWVPQMADGKDVMAAIARRDGTIYSTLTPNLTGYQAAMKAKANEVVVFASASETFSRRNINCSIAESLMSYEALCQQARADSMPVRGYVSCVVACPYEGPIDPGAVCDVARSLLDMGCREISLGDTIGVATPEQISRLLDSILKIMPVEKIAGHFHDTSGRALDCIRVSLDKGVRIFDCAVGGVGGCPFAPGSQGNVATGAVVEMLEGAGYQTGIDQTALQKAATFISQILERAP